MLHTGVRIMSNESNLLQEFDEASKPEVEVSISELNQRVAEYTHTKREIKQIEADTKERLAPLKTEATKQEVEMLEILEANLLDKWAVDKIGIMTKVAYTSVPQPKSMEDKKAFMAYVIEQHGEEYLYENLLTFNGTKLPSFVKSELESKAIEGNPFFKIPGIEPSGTINKIKFTDRIKRGEK
jgi:hypothetical protein